MLTHRIYPELGFIKLNWVTSVDLVSEGEPSSWVERIETSTGELVYDADEARSETIIARKLTVVVNLCFDESDTAINSDKFVKIATPKHCVVFIPEKTEIKEVYDGTGEMVMFEIDQNVIQHYQETRCQGLLAPARYSCNTICPEMGQMARNIRNLLLSGKSLDELQMDSLALELQQKALSRYFAQNDRQSVAGSKLSLSALQKVRSFIEANLHKRIVLEELSDIASLSPFHFNRAFKNTTGESPYQMVLERRLMAARRMLTKTDHSICDIALMTGFTSQSHLTDLLKRSIGVTPNRFRKGL